MDKFTVDPEKATQSTEPCCAKLEVELEPSPEGAIAPSIFADDATGAPGACVLKTCQFSSEKG
jgi:hypothetical protein